MTLDELKVYIGTRIMELREELHFADEDSDQSYFEGLLEAYEHMLGYIEANE